MDSDGKLLSTTDAARLLNVGASSIKRWADENLLSCVRTAGGHRRFRREDLERFRHQGRDGVGNGEDLEAMARTWLDKLLAEDEPLGVVAALMEQRARQGSWHAVADSLGPTLEEMGRRWEQGWLTIMQEHVASARLARALAWCAGSLPVVSAAPCVLLATAEPDEHTLGLSLAELCAREAGWNTRWAGARTPLGEVAQEVSTGELGMVVLSASLHSANAQELAVQAESVIRAAREGGAAVVLGGQGAWPEQPQGAHRLRDFAAFHALLVRLRG